MNLENQTHTLPLALMAGLLVLGVVAWWRLYRSKRELQTVVEGQFKQFREKAVSLMDQIDALRRRHDTLPATDPDFTQPMAGSTLALYNAVEGDLNGLWDRWLKVMELWDHAQKLVRSSSGLAVRQAEEARKLLNKGDIDELLRQSGSCKERLDRLNGAHEMAREDLKQGKEELATLRETLEQGSGAVTSTSAGGDDAQISRIEKMLAQVDATMVADPIGAEEIIARSRRLMAGRARGTDRESQRTTISRPTYSPLDDLSAAADAFRTAAAKLRLTNLLGVFARFWLVVWGLSFLFGLLNFLMPLIIFLLSFVLVLAGFWAIWHLVTFWFWYGMWGVRR